MKSIRAISFILTLLFILITIIPSSVVNAESYKLDSMLIKLSNGQVIKISIMEYMKALNLKDQSPIFKFLKEDRNTPLVFGVNSGDKYISVSSFMQALNKSGKDISNAIEIANPVTESEFKLIKEFKKFDEEGNPVLEEITPQEPKIYTLVEIQEDALDTSMSVFGVYSVSIKFINLQRIFPETSQDTIFVLRISNEEMIELKYDLDTDSFANWDIQGYDEVSLLNAIVEIAEELDPGDVPDDSAEDKIFRVIDIY